MFVDVETDRNILSALYGSADLSSLGIEDVAVLIQGETIGWSPWQEQADGYSGD